MPYNINLKHLECFIKVAQLGSINKAAQALFISQPHLGKIIHDLENEMGYLLLNRSNQGVTLTPEGEEEPILCTFLTPEGHPHARGGGVFKACRPGAGGDELSAATQHKNRGI